MDKLFFERNLLALSQKDPALCARLSGAETTRERYRFLNSRAGEIVPALVNEDGAARPLHSLIDPEKEGNRLVSTLADEGYLIFFGLGGAFHIEAALKRQDVHRVVTVEYDIHGIAELLASKEYIALLGDSRFHLLVDPAAGELEAFILETYQPALFGGIRLIPLRTRTAFDQGAFNAAAEEVSAAIDRLSTDYSVQAYFGRRWFANIIRNLFEAGKQQSALPPVRNAAICAAGPSLDRQLSFLAERRSSRYLIATDTSLPALLQGGFQPDAVVSIDCQHISYYHFMPVTPAPLQIPLFLDLSSPPLLTAQSAAVRFFAGGHPLARYAARYWRSFPEVDTSGANVTYAALSLAECLGAETIELYGADFSYPLGRTYARGTYIYPYFEARQNRLAPLEARHSAFLFRTSLTKKTVGPGAWYYETPSLRAYREVLEAKARRQGARLTAVPGEGAPLNLACSGRSKHQGPYRLFAPGKASMSAKEFLSSYRNAVAALPLPEENMARYLERLAGGAKQILATLLPAAAALKRREHYRRCGPVLEAVKEDALAELDKVLKTGADVC
ncbi:MAG: DUF115 domain-containing protein [Treponema sp.]|nr:DUF115 domain-containing protein [Treponema sp.]